MQPQLLLALSVKAMNETLGPEGFVPSTLIFGDFPNLRTVSGPVIPRPSLAKRAEGAQQARHHMSEFLPQVKMHHAMTIDVTSKIN